MEGNLLKWTNYWMGWQLRYFVLKDGILSYFNNKNEIKSGAKRSFKIFMFDIIVSKNDNTRLDLIVANDQHLYLKACDYKERQKWLVALASQKATHSTKQVPTTSSNALNTSDQILNSNTEDHSDSFKILSNSFQNNLTPFDSTNMLKIKQSELRLYCDLLTQQTHELKNLVNTQNSNEKSDLSGNDVMLSLETIKTDSNKIEIVSLSNLNDSNHSAKTNNDNSSAASSFKSVDNFPSENLNNEKDEDASFVDEKTETKSTVKKMDEITSNINITCDMVIQIIRNVIVLSNTSSNVSPAALASLLEESNLNQSQANSTKSTELLVDNLSQYRYHLHHPLNTNSQLNKYRRNSTSDANLINEK